MFRKFSILFILILTLTGLPVDVASAQDMPSLDLPPGIAAQAQPLLEAMMEQMQQSGMTHDQMQMMYGRHAGYGGSITARDLPEDLGIDVAARYG